MPSLLQCIFLVALVALTVLAAPQAHIQKRSFKVERVANPNFRRHVNHKRAPGAGTRALVKAYRKYGVALPQGLVDAMGNIPAAAHVTENVVGANSVKAAAAAANSTGAGKGTVAATPEQGDVEYLAPINIGGQTMNMDFDSGSSDLWIFSTKLPAASQTGHQNFDSTKSTSFKAITGASFSISYGDGSGAAGMVGTDTVNIGGATVTSQAIELATTVSASFVSDTNSNGLVGLAYSKLNTVKPTQQKTFFDNAMPSLAQPVFTADLRKAAVGSYEFGNIDSTKFNGSLQWTAVNTTQGFWQFSSTKFSVGTGAAMANPGNQAIADTGTTLMLANAAVINGYYSQVQGAVNNATVGGVTFPCAAKLPDLNVDVGGNFNAVVRGDDINFAPVDATGQTCFGGLQAISGNLQIFGDIMFKSNFVVFNGGNNSLAMAPHGA
ncbi:aspartyl protease-1 [Coleophoma crateriformis]|uniref:Aspartyl protease-1 n=1 Tax=Coleophoma crateriformis TaxID=565419 RepID=A0A3D8S2P1_9HELO|nr:aspartyl protease-1 [Coleophoma crateriformis]